MQIIGTHHIALKTTNFAVMRAFYTDLLGMPYLGGFPNTNIIFLGAGGTTIELIEAAADAGQPTTPPVGWVHVALEVADTDAAYAELVSKGVVFHVAPRTVQPGETPLVRLAFFRDPDGNELEIFQPIGNKYPQQ